MLLVVGLCLKCEAGKARHGKRQLAANLMLISLMCRDLAEDSWGVSRISNPTTGLGVRRVVLVSWAEGVTEGSLMPKNCLVYVPSPYLTGLGALVLFHVVIESGNVNECFILEHTGADSFRELLDLFLNVCEEGV